MAGTKKPVPGTKAFSNFMDRTIIIIGVVQSIFGILLFITKRPQHLSFIFLTIWLALIAIFLGSFLLPFEVVEYFKPGIFPILFLFGPLLYLYLGSLTTENFRLKPALALHLLPFVVICVLRSLKGSVSIWSPSDLSENPLYIYNKIYYSFLIISLFIYWFLSLRLVIKHKRNIPYNFSNYTPGNTLNWSVFVLSLFLVFFIADFSMFYINKVLNLEIFKISLLPVSLTVFTFIMIFFGINQIVIYPAYIKTPKNDSKEPEPSATVRKDRTLIDEKQRETLSEMVFEYLKSNKPYLNPDFSLQMMADDLNISRQKLSYLINSGQGKNFYKLVNEFRVQEVKDRLSDPEYKTYSVLGIGLECGFNSKASFNRIFKEETGFTPTEFKKLKTQH